MMRTTYSDLVTILDDVFLPQRTGGAEELDRRAQLWHEDETTMIGSYAIWVGRDPNSVNDPRLWLVLTAGIWPETDADHQQVLPMTPYNIGHATSGSLDRFELGSGAPVLILPRPIRPTFTVQVRSGSFPGKGIIFEREATVEGATFQWTARDPEVLAANVLRDISRVFPGVLSPSS